MSSIWSKYSLYFGWIVALLATGGSLYFSEVIHFIPCTLCWYQRILMYPLVILLGIASYRGYKEIYSYVLPMTILGWIIAFYHYFGVEQEVFGQLESPFCQAGAPCNAKWINWLGFITIPFLSFIAFTLITIFMIVTWRNYKQSQRSEAGN
jgi:disulfide bond formation protein DsbB